MSGEAVKVDIDVAGAADADRTTGAGGLTSANDNRRQRRPPKWTWQGVLASTTALAGAAAVLLHLMGNAIHRAYFFEWGIDTGPFPKSGEWLVIMGYYGVSNALGMAMLAMLKHWYVVALSGVGLALYLRLLNSSWNPLDAVDKWSSLTSKLPGWVRQSVLASTGGALVGLFSLPIVLVLVVLLGIPAEIGRNIGVGIAQKEAKDFAQGCEASKRQCIRLLREGVLVGEGFLLESSQSHLAFLDVSMQRVRVLLRENLELQPLRLPKVN